MQQISRLGELEYDTRPNLRWQQEQENQILMAITLSSRLV